MVKVSNNVNKLKFGAYNNARSVCVLLIKLKFKGEKMESIITNIRIDTKKKISNADLEILNNKIEDILTDFSQDQSDNGNSCDIGWSWWNHINVI